MKKITAIILALIMVFALCACGAKAETASQAANTVTDPDANAGTESVPKEYGSAQTTTKIMTDDSVARESKVAGLSATGFENFVDVPLTVVNHTKTDLDGLYISSSDSETWGANLLEGDVLEAGASTTGLTMSFDKDHQHWDIKTVDEGGVLEFNDMFFGKCSHSGIVIDLIENNDGSFTCNII